MRGMRGGYGGAEMAGGEAGAGEAGYGLHTQPGGTLTVLTHNHEVPHCSNTQPGGTLTVLTHNQEVPHCSTRPCCCLGFVY